MTHTGAVAGKETVQVYVHDHQAGLVRPPKELKGFAKVELRPGETQTVSIPLNFRSFAYYHPAYKGWITEDGEFDILIDASAGDIRCSLALTLQSTLELPSVLDRESTLREWLGDRRGQPVIDPLYQMMQARMEQVLADGGKTKDAMLREMMDMPLRSSLHYQEAELPMPADELVDWMLSQVQETRP
ncbi:MAG TPA: fibronectin type III-like domain-contianing protein [Anaerolineales bacterium]